MEGSSSSRNVFGFTGALVEGSTTSGRSTIFSTTSLESGSPTPAGWCTGGRRRTEKASTGSGAGFEGLLNSASFS